MSMSVPAWRRLFALPLLIAALVMTLGNACGRELEYRSFESPNGDYRVVVFRRERAAGMMPGQSGDAPGTVRLLDRNGLILREADVEMVQLVENVEWQDDHVHIKLIADWPLRQ